MIFNLAELLQNLKVIWLQTTLFSHEKIFYASHVCFGRPLDAGPGALLG